MLKRWRERSASGITDTRRVTLIQQDISTSSAPKRKRTRARSRRSAKKKEHDLESDLKNASEADLDLIVLNASDQDLAAYGSG